MTTTPGIDVSRWQGDIQWEKVASAGYRFAVIRATVGETYTDPRFDANWAGARDAGLLVSAYHVLKPEHPADSQVARLFETLGDRRADLPLVLDIELHGDPALPTSRPVSGLLAEGRADQAESRSSIPPGGLEQSRPYRRRMVGVRFVGRQLRRGHAITTGGWEEGSSAVFE
jgi:hypothetical protein